MRFLPLGPISKVRDNWRNLSADGIRLFFPIAAVHAMIGPLLWACVYGLDLPFTRLVPSEQWQTREMMFGTFAAAMGGAMMSIIAERNDAAPKQGRTLLMLLALWLPGRLAGLAGVDVAVVFGTATDLAYLFLLGWFVLRSMIARRSGGHFLFLILLLLLGATEIAICAAWIAKDFELCARLLQTALMIFVIMLAFAYGRINVVVLNLALDPSGATTPYRPHPGRQNLASVMVALYALAFLAFPQSRMSAFLALAAGCAFMDRLAEWFIGPRFFKSHVLAFALTSCFAGFGLIVIGLARLGMPWPAIAGIHILSLGGEGLAVITVFSIAGLRHTGQPLALPWQARVAIVLMIVACFVRVLPELGVFTSLAGLYDVLSMLCWSAAYALWLLKYLPLLLNPPVSPDRFCRQEP